MKSSPRFAAVAAADRLSHPKLEPLPGDRLGSGRNVGIGAAAARVFVVARQQSRGSHEGGESLQSTLLSLVLIGPTPQGMQEGVAKTNCVLLFLSKGTMARPYVQVSSAEQHMHAVLVSEL